MADPVRPSLLAGLMAKKAGVSNESNVTRPASQDAKGNDSGSPKTGSILAGLASSSPEGRTGDSSVRAELLGTEEGAAGGVSEKTSESNEQEKAKAGPVSSGILRVGDNSEPKAEAPKAESNPVQGSVPSDDLGTSKPEAPKAHSILGVLGTQPNRKSDDSKPQSSDDNERANSEVGSKAVAPAKSSILTGLTAQRAKAEATKADYDYLFDEVPKDFQETLNRFDAMMQRDQGDIDVNLPKLRDYVMRIMVDLRENPEYDGMFIDRDAHNVIAFMRRTKGQAMAIANEKQEKATKKSTKAGKSGANRFAMDLGNLDLGGEPKQKAQMSLEDLSNLEF